MNESDSPGRRERLLEPQSLEALRSGSKEESAEAYSLLRRRSHQQLESRFGTLTNEDYDDIFSAAVADTLPLLLDRDVSAEEVSHDFAKALDRHKKRSKRERSRRVLERGTSDYEESSTTRDLLIDLERVVAEIEDVLEEALATLRESDRLILIEDYRLEPIPRPSAFRSPSSRNDSARRQARVRARRRFNEALEERIERRLADPGANRDLLEAALSVVRGGDLPSALALVSSPRER